MADTNRFLLAAGAIPTLTWLDGTSEGEKDIEELLEVAMSTGATAINVIPDRNYTPGAKGEKIENLYQVVELAQKLHLPVVEGTEMNSPGQKFVDSFDTPELAPLVTAEKNEFFEELGNILEPEKEDKLSGLSEDVTAKEILNKISN